MDDLKTTNEPVQPTPSSGVVPDQNLGQTEPIPQPTEPAAPPPAQPTVEPSPPQPTLTPPPITTVTTETPLPPAPLSEKPSGKKIPSAIKIGGALIILLMAATLPATIILVQNKTILAPKAEEVTMTPTPIVKPIGTAKTFIALTKEEEESIQAEPMKPKNLEIKAVSSGSVKITFSTQGAYPSLIRYSPDEDWNYLTMFQEGDIGDEWQQRYHSENQVNVEPVGGEAAKTQHEFVLENLVMGKKYYFVIEIEKTEEKTVYIFGSGQPEGYYTFVAE